MEKTPPFSMRQGDVLVLDAAYVGGLPADTQDMTPPAGRIVLALGEVTGHAHAFYDNTQNINLRSGGGNRFLQIKADAELKHEEHDTVVVPARDYLLPVQVEFAPAALMQVSD